jgi:single stranded DNA-binding protein
MDGVIACALVKLTADAELRYTPNGKAVLNLSTMVVDARREEGATPEWLRVTVWGDLAEQLQDSLPKGSECYVEGRLRLNEWDGSFGPGCKRSGSSAARCAMRSRRTCTRPSKGRRRSAGRACLRPRPGYMTDATRRNRLSWTAPVQRGRDRWR